jgi:small ligand-binding sensory domain FIST
VIELDGQPALDVLLKDLNVSLEEPAQALQAVRATLVGLMRQAQASAAVNDSSPVGRTGNFGPDVIVRHIIGLDPTRRGLAVADLVAPGMQLAFCQRNAKAAPT